MSEDTCHSPCTATPQNEGMAKHNPIIALYTQEYQSDAVVNPPKALRAGRPEGKKFENQCKNLGKQVQAPPTAQPIIIRKPVTEDTFNLTASEVHSDFKTKAAAPSCHPETTRLRRHNTPAHLNKKN